jgi:hypothetical protein
MRRALLRVAVDRVIAAWPLEGTRPIGLSDLDDAIATILALSANLESPPARPTQAADNDDAYLAAQRLLLEDIPEDLQRLADALEDASKIAAAHEMRRAIPPAMTSRLRKSAAALSAIVPSGPADAFWRPSSSSRVNRLRRLLEDVDQILGFEARLDCLKGYSASIHDEFRQHEMESRMIALRMDTLAIRRDLHRVAALAHLPLKSRL